MDGLKKKRDLRSRHITYDSRIVTIGKIRKRPADLTATIQDNGLWVAVMLWCGAWFYI
jgi:hypothetical protein